MNGNGKVMIMWIMKFGLNFLILGCLFCEVLDID